MTPRYILVEYMCYNIIYVFPFHDDTQSFVANQLLENCYIQGGLLVTHNLHHILPDMQEHMRVIISVYPIPT